MTNHRTPAESSCRLYLVCGYLRRCSAAAQTTTQQTVSPQTITGSDESSDVKAATATSMPFVVADAVQDFRHIPSWTNLAILAAGGLGAASGIHPTVRDARVVGSPGMGTLLPHR
jgi:hypothetical protein